MTKIKPINGVEATTNAWQEIDRLFLPFASCHLKPP
jgi:hypothetical protein